MSKVLNTRALRRAAEFAGANRPVQRISLKSAAFSSVSAFALVLGFGQTSFAQTQAAQTNVEEIVVTGSHIARDGYEAPAPITVVSADQISASGKEDLANYINLMPSVLGSFTPQGYAISGVGGGGQNGVNSISLRGLGPTRTLVLIDGRRTAASAPDGTVDVSSFPQELISRVDVVTSGASAAYGSDAVAGVVNFILDKQYTGVKGSLEGGVTTYGDNRNWKTTLTAGTKFANDRGHFLISGTAAFRQGILNGLQREWTRELWETFGNPAYGTGAGQTTSVPAFLFLPQVGVSGGTQGGLITNTALKGTAFGPGGTPYQYNYGSIVGPVYMAGGGEWQTSIPVRIGTLDPRSKRKTLYTYTSYDLTDNIQAYAEVSWASSYSETQNQGRDDLGTLLTIKADNPYIPTAVRSRMTALGITQFNMGRLSIDLFNPEGSPALNTGRFNRIQNRYTVGLNGNVDAFGSNWTWDAHFHTGETRTSEKYQNTAGNAKFNGAVDAVISPTTGAIICRSTLTTPNDGCVPINLLGVGTVSQAAYNYVSATPQRNQRFSEDNFAVTVRGEPFSIWAGPVSFATGFEWRKDSIGGSSNAIALGDLARAGNYKPTIGSFSVAEGFFETVVPLAKDESWAKTLDINAAVRFTNYSVSGSVVTYKFGATWQPVNDLRFRATRSHDIRAPTLGELFQAGSSIVGNFVDPFLPGGNQTVPTRSQVLGNLNLTPEKADSTQVGVVVQPTFLPGFSASIDFWNIKIRDGIGALTAQQIINNCFLGQAPACAVVTRSPGFNTVQVVPFNLASQTRRGIDFEAGYHMQMSDVVDSWGGTFDIRALATRYIKALVSTGVTPPLDLVGQNGQDLGAIAGVPRFVYNVSLTYALDPISVTLAGRGFGSGNKDNRATECTSGCPVSSGNNPTINNNHMAGAFYIDASISYDFNENGQLFFAVTNLTNLAPEPFVGISNPAGFFQPAINSVLYDPVGRSFRAGVKFKM
jgi:iron complex outermembrane receptor protein